MTWKRLGTRLMILIVGVVFLLVAQTPATGPAPSNYKAVAFDYFVIFDPNSVIPEIEKSFPGKGAEVAKAWRNKQFEYSFLHSMSNDPEDFFKITGDALDYTMAQMKLRVDDDTRARLLDAYMTLKPWPDAVEGIKRLRAAGVRIIALSNFCSMMLRSNAVNAGISGLFDDLVSTESSGSYKPDPRAYELGLKTLNLPKDKIVFAASASWDAYGGKHFGFPTVWVNRLDLPDENLGVPADKTTPDMSGLLQFVLGSAQNEPAPVEHENASR